MSIKPEIQKKSIETFDIVENIQQTENAPHRFWGSARMTYTICAFLAMILHLSMRNSLDFVILCMIKPHAEELTMSTAIKIEENRCGVRSFKNETKAMIERTGDLPWTRSQEFLLQGTFYYGYIVTLPISGMLADRFGGKLLFVHSITLQALVFMMIPYFARLNFLYAVICRVVQGLISGLGNPALYQLFSTWAHPSERTVLVSFAFAGYSVSSLLIYPLSGVLCQIGWELAFYIVGGTSLLIGMTFNWLVYSKLKDHPRLSKEEYEYLKITEQEKSKQTVVPWKSIFTSVPVYAFTLTHVFHTYGVLVLTLMTPRFLKEAMHFSMSEIGIYSSAQFFGALISKVITIISCGPLEVRFGSNLTKFKRLVYVLCNGLTVICIVGIVFCDCTERVIVVILTVCIGISSDLNFSGAYWPSLLFVAPSYAGLLAGLSNSLATTSGFLAPYGISIIVQNGTKLEWNYVLLSMATSYVIGAFVFGLFGSSKLQPWGQSEKNVT